MNDTDLKTITDAMDGLLILTRDGLKRTARLLLVCVAALIVCLGALFWNQYRVHEQQQTIDDLTIKLSLLIDEQTKTRQVAEKTAAKVDEQADDQRPTVEIVPVPATAGKKASAVVVIKPRKPIPLAGASGSALPAPAPIEIPVKLPEGSKVQEKL